VSEVREPARSEERPTELERLIGWIDERTGLAQVTRTTLRKVFPDHWSFLLGELALFSFIILVLTGVFLTFFFTADSRPVIYDGSYAPLRGQQVSAAFASVLRISFDVRAGLLFRQIHHWTALVFVAVIAAHMMRIFFTGAFRRPRELNWLIGVGLVLLALAEGLTGYSLPDDLLSGTGMRIFYGAAMSVPFVGPNIAYLIFGGEFPTEFTVGRLFVFHVMLLPALFIGAIGAHVVLVFLQKHTQFKGPGRTEENVVGSRFWPMQVFRSSGLFFLTAGVLALVAGFFEINPVWLYGPYLPWVATAPSQPDWYMGWLEGALRLGLPIEPTIFGITIPSPFWPAILLPGILFGVIVLWPWVEKRLTHDHRPHNLLDWPWEAPMRTATGVAVLTFFGVQLIAGANDVLALFFRVNLNDLTWFLRGTLVVAPVLAWLIAYRLCRERQRRHSGQVGAAGTPIRRGPSGGFVDAEEAAE
jgi:ubiquinol-cytochrome c reductase cytochrome b subunit